MSPTDRPKPSIFPNKRFPTKTWAQLVQCSLTGSPLGYLEHQFDRLGFVIKSSSCSVIPSPGRRHKDDCPNPECAPGHHPPHPAHRRRGRGRGPGSGGEANGESVGGACSGNFRRGLRMLLAIFAAFHCTSPVSCHPEVFRFSVSDRSCQLTCFTGWGFIENAYKMMFWRDFYASASFCAQKYCLDNHRVDPYFP